MLKVTKWQVFLLPSAPRGSPGAKETKSDFGGRKRWKVEHALLTGYGDQYEQA